MRLAGKVAIITGAAGGMGEAAAHLFAREGAKVVAVDIDEAKVEPVASAIRVTGGDAIAVGCDVTQSAQIIGMVDRTMSEYGLPTVLFNNAGVDTEQKRSILDIDEDAFDRVLEVNLKGAWLVIKHVAPKMIEAGGGSIVNTASVGAEMVCSTAGYCASKAGLVSLTKVAAVELGRYGIRVNALNPGATETPMAKHQREEMIKNGLPISSDVLDRIGVLGRMAEPIEMAHVALFLASDDASFATGMTFNNDAGWTAMSGISVQKYAQ
jgi:NAD(P)-dependent dehydrogenase (short-subunit alcohol dehydrogenase family)